MVTLMPRKGALSRCRGVSALTLSRAPAPQRRDSCSLTSVWGLPALLLALALLAGCAVPGAASAARPTACAAGGCPSSATSVTPPSACVAASCAASRVQVFVEPDAGEAPILHGIASAQRTLWVEVYILSDRNVTRALESAAQRGVDVRVLLEPHPFGGGDVSAQKLIEELNAAGVHAQPSDPAYYYTHAKLMLVDGATAYILTSNLSKSGLGGTASGANREYGVIDTDPGDVAEIGSILQADWNHTTPALTQARLLVSPVNSRPGLLTLIGSATATIQIEDEEFYDQPSEDALVAAAKRGIRVEVVLPAGTTGESADIARLTGGGVHVRLLTAPYPHAKLVIVDRRVAFVGSQNFSSTSLDQNREVGIVLADPAALATVTQVFGQDWSLASDA